MKITDMIISAILKKGILYEAANMNVDVCVPIDLPNNEGKETEVRIYIQADNVKLRIEKEA